MGNESWKDKLEKNPLYLIIPIVAIISGTWTAENYVVVKPKEAIIEQLKSQNGELDKKVKDLENQINQLNKYKQIEAGDILNDTWIYPDRVTSIEYGRILIKLTSSSFNGASFEIVSSSEKEPQELQYLSVGSKTKFQSNGQVYYLNVLQVSSNSALISVSKE
jgi:hypothetical protein